jgi:prevent-host-death family protein
MTTVMTMPTISKGVLKAKLLELLRQVEASGEELIITDRGVPVLKVVTIPNLRSAESLFGDVRGSLAFSGNLDDPTVDEWTDA